MADAGYPADHAAALRQLAAGPGEDDQVHPDLTLRLADRLVAAGKDFGLLILPGAEHARLDGPAYVRGRYWDFLVRELMGSRPPGYRPAPIAIGRKCSRNRSAEGGCRPGGEGDRGGVRGCERAGRVGGRALGRPVTVRRRTGSAPRGWPGRGGGGGSA